MIEITDEYIKKFDEEFKSNDKNILAMNSVTNNGISKSCINSNENYVSNHNFSITIESGKVTNQKQSGRCWMFAALNFMRLEVMKNLNLENMELSQSYPLFYDKLEKANFFLENIIDSIDLELDSREVDFLLKDPMQDGGQWDMFKSLVKKYGVIPQEVMPEVNLSSATREMDKYLTMKLREGAKELRENYSFQNNKEVLRPLKDKMLDEIYRMLCICLGIPPKRFTFETRDKDKKFIRIEDITPQEFFSKYVNINLDDYVSIINAPTKNKPMNKTFTVKYLGNVYGGDKVLYLNLPIDRLKDLAIKQMSDGMSVWFGSDVSQYSIRNSGILALSALDISNLFSTRFNLTKGDRLDYLESSMNHAMLLTGVNIDSNNKPTRFRVENSWGKDVGRDGYYVMSNDWFDEYVYQVVINKKYLTVDELELLKVEPIVLDPWDPMGSLAVVKDDFC